MRGKALTLIAVLATLLASAPVKAETFTSADFLGWKHESQTYYFRVAIGMAGLIARRNDETQGDCIDNWYFNAESEAHRQIIRVMQDNPSYHPRGVILAILEKRCGKLAYR